MFVVSTQHAAPHKCITVPLLPGFHIPQSGGSGGIPQPPAAHLERAFGAFGAVSVTLTRHHKQLSC